MKSRTIAALSSAKGPGAIAVIRISGCGAFDIVEKCLEPKEAFHRSRAQHIRLYNIVSPLTSNPVDQITAVKYAAPHSYTGEDMVELFCHGGEIVVEKVLSALVEAGADLAERGEFTRRAFLNGKFNLVHAESILGIIESRTRKEYEASLEALMGASSKRLVRWREAVKVLLRDLDARIEYPEEEEVQANSDQTSRRITEIRKDIEKELFLINKSRHIEKGIIVPIVGIANAGKSSLFNLLVGYDRAIVHWKEGTTRDGVGEEIEIAGERVMLLDTAGLRDTEDDVEQLGIQKTLEYIGKAALVIWVTPADTGLTGREKQMLDEPAQKKIAAVISKRDLGDAAEKEKTLREKNVPFLTCCLLDARDRKALVDFVEKIVGRNIAPVEISGVLLTQRHEAVAGRIVEELKQAENYGKNGEEVIAAGLRRILSLFGEIIGETTSEDVLNSIFSQFCIGK